MVRAVKKITADVEMVTEVEDDVWFHHKTNLTILAWPLLFIVGFERAFSLFVYCKIQGIYLCFNSQYKQLFTLTLANNLGFEHDVICFADSVKALLNWAVKINCFGLG